ncbi:hypothetical protein KFU94_43300 [Chloroflexi bacterium TSY]|nr:hypothetical protein [Chloroflexi bacterium TSY]
MDGKAEFAMRRFSSYGPIDIRTEYYVPRAELVEQGLRQVLGENPELGGALHHGVGTATARKDMDYAERVVASAGAGI